MSQTRCPQSRRTLCAPSGRSAPLPSPLVCFQPSTTTRGEACAFIHFPALFAFLFLFAMGEAIDHTLNRRDACPLTGGGVHNNDFRGNELAPQVASRQMLHPQTQMICHTNPDHDIIYIYTYTYLHTHTYIRTHQHSKSLHMSTLRKIIITTRRAQHSESQHCTGPASNLNLPPTFPPLIMSLP